MYLDISGTELTKEEREKLIAEKFQSLTIKDDFMFCKVMQDEKICKEVLNILLQDYFRINTIKIATSQATIKNHPELKFVRLDVLATDEAGNSYDIEMQVVNRKNIEKRIRAYQVAVDMFKMQKGIDYNALSNTIIIFITPFDPFGAGLPVYFIEQYVKDNTDIKFNDGTYKIIFNTKAFEDVKENKMRELLKFFDTGKATLDVAKEMEMKVEAIKRDSIIFSQFFSTFASLTDARDDGIKKGIEKGIEKGSYAKAIETAKKAHRMGLPITTIIELTGLSEAEILKLKG